MVLDPHKNYDEDYVLSKVEGKESNISMLASGLWNSMALFLDAFCKHNERKKVAPSEAIAALFDVAEDLNANKFKKETEFFEHVLNCGISSRVVVDALV